MTTLITDRTNELGKTTWLLRQAQNSSFRFLSWWRVPASRIVSSPYTKITQACEDLLRCGADIQFSSSRPCLFCVCEYTCHLLPTLFTCKKLDENKSALTKASETSFRKSYELKSKYSSRLYQDFRTNEQTQIGRRRSNRQAPDVRVNGKTLSLNLFLISFLFFLARLLYPSEKWDAARGSTEKKKYFPAETSFQIARKLAIPCRAPLTRQERKDRPLR